MVNYVGRFFAAEFFFGLVGEAEEDLEGGGQEESQAGKRERERPLEGDDLGPGSDLLDGVKLGQAGDDWMSGDRGDDTLSGGLGNDRRRLNGRLLSGFLNQIFFSD